MQLIPVIDIKDGVAVHARRGQRAHYRALHTPFAATPDPTAVVAGMLAALPCTTIYLADLDAIAGRAGNVAVIEAIVARHPELTIWLDAGFANVAAVAAVAPLPGVTMVLASESIASVAVYRALCAVTPPARTVLSLDRTSDGALGCAALFDTPTLWPAHVIHMNLAVVGAAAGPDWSGLEALLMRAGARHVYAAGGVRDERDLDRLATMGISGALVATALHDGRIDAAAFARSTNKNAPRRGAS